MRYVGLRSYEIPCSSWTLKMAIPRKACLTVARYSKWRDMNNYIQFRRPAQYTASFLWTFFKLSRSSFRSAVESIDSIVGGECNQ